MIHYMVTYRERGQMGWNKLKNAEIKAESKDEVRQKFWDWANKPSQYSRTLVSIGEIEEERFA